jgi:hypothetical protein
MALDRHQVDLSIKKPIYDPAMRRMKKLQRREREQYGVKRTSLSDIGREAIMRYQKGDGADYEPRIARSPAGLKPKREPFRFDVAAKAYEKQKEIIAKDGHKVTQVVEEALKRFTDTGELPWSQDGDE